MKGKANGSKTSEGQPAIKLAGGPRDKSWHLKIEKAKEARAAARELRKGKPASFTVLSARSTPK